LIEERSAKRTTPTFAVAHGAAQYLFDMTFAVRFLRSR